MKYREAMNMKCNCGEQSIVLWQGNHISGYPSFSHISIPIETECGLMYEEHTLNACYKPCRIKSKGE